MSDQKVQVLLVEVQDADTGDLKGFGLFEGGELKAHGAVEAERDQLTVWDLSKVVAQANGSDLESHHVATEGEPDWPAITQTLNAAGVLKSRLQRFDFQYNVFSVADGECDERSEQAAYDAETPTHAAEQAIDALAAAANDVEVAGRGEWFNGIARVDELGIPTLLTDGDGDYVMTGGEGSRVHIAVGPVIVLLNRTHEGLIVDVMDHTGRTVFGSVGVMATDAAEVAGEGAVA